MSLLLAELGFLTEQRGDPAAARTWHLEGLATARQAGDPRAIALAQEGLAGVAAAEGAWEEASALLEEAATRRASVGAPLPAAERGDIDRITAAIHTAASGQPPVRRPSGDAQCAPAGSGTAPPHPPPPSAAPEPL